MKRTPLYDSHVRLGARMVDFNGWEMPIQYKAGIVEEHLAVRRRAGIFDVSHMGRVEVDGPNALALIQRVITNDAGRLQVGDALYSLICREDGGILDDVIVYRTGETQYLIVVNAGNRDRDFNWLQAQVPAVGNVTATNRSDATAMIAFQGPQAIAILQPLVDVDLASVRRMASASVRIQATPALIGRTGYTGEDGVEIICGAGDAIALWDLLLAQDVMPCGLGARDTLRLEAALPLYGNDIDTTTNPLEAGLGWAVVFDRGDFIGREALLAVKAAGGPTRRLACLEMVDPGIPRSHFEICHEGQVVGHVASGSYSPMLQKGIAMGYLPVGLTKPGNEVEIDIRGRLAKARAVKRPFYAGARG